MKVLVTGGAGFIGSNLVDELIAAKNQVAVIDDLSSGSRENLHPQADFYQMDIRSSSLASVLQEVHPDAVVHLAAQTSVQESLLHPVHDGNINILGCINLYKSCVQRAVPQIIYISSAAVYGEPHYLGIDEEHPIGPRSFYGLSKYCGEKYLQLFAATDRLNYTILRLANVYGPRQKIGIDGGVAANFFSRLMEQQPPVIYGSGNQTRDFIYVGDVVSAIIKSMNRGHGQILNIGTNSSLSINRLLELVEEAAGLSIDPMKERPREGDIEHSFLNNQRATGQLKWWPGYSLQQGLYLTSRYYQTGKKQART